MDLPPVTLSKTRKSQIISQLYLYREINLKSFSEQTGVAIVAIKDYIQLLIQALILRGYYRKDRFVLVSAYRYPRVNPGRLSNLRRNLLGVLVSNKKINIHFLRKILNISSEELISHLLFLTVRGLFIGSLKNQEILVQKIWMPFEKVKISSDDTFIIGTCMLLRDANLNKVAKLTGFTLDEVFNTITKLMLYKKLEASFEVSGGIVGSSKISVNVKKYLITPRALPMEALQGDERSVVGYTILKKEADIEELAKYIDKKEKEVVKIIAVLTARGTFQFIFNEKNKIVPVIIPDTQPNQTIEEMAALSFFNYEALFGLLSTQERIPLRKLATLMNREVDEVLEGVMNLYLEGFVTCTLKGATIHVDSLKRYSRTQEGTLERWEKIVLGMIIAKKSITTKDIEDALGIDKNHAKERMYGFYGKGLIKGKITGNKLEPEEIPIFPPLVQLDDLPIHYQEIFGYIISNSRVSFRNIMKFWEKTLVASKNIVYELTGSGLMNISSRGSTVTLVSSQKFLPNKQLNELGEIYTRVTNEIEKSRRKRIKLTTIANSVEMEPLDLFKMLCQLISHGYYKGVLTSAYFERVGKITLPKGKNYCLNCGYVIKSSTESCGNCRQLHQKCMVCQGLIKKGDNVKECPTCNNVAHEDHLEQWMKIKQECPICKTRISKRNLKKYSA
ncbi:MAG: RING finger domain-containing protein [Candidatus Heimdallarchaeaceae archaeon]